MAQSGESFGNTATQMAKFILTLQNGNDLTEENIELLLKGISQLHASAAAGAALVKS